MTYKETESLPTDELLEYLYNDGCKTFHVLLTMFDSYKRESYDQCKLIVSKFLKDKKLLKTL